MIRKLRKKFIAAAVVAVLLVLLVLIALVMIFKDQITSLMRTLMNKVSTQSGKV